VQTHTIATPTPNTNDTDQVDPTTGLTQNSSNTWGYFDLVSSANVTRAHLQAVLEGRSAGIRVRQAVDPAACAEVADRIEAHGTSRYPGMRNALGTVFPNHWSARYVNGDFDSYFDAISDTEDVKAYMFEPFGSSPREIANRILEPVLGRRIERLRCPVTGRLFHSVIVRTGTADFHYDFGGYDLPVTLAPYVMRQTAWNLYLRTAEAVGGELEVFKVLGTKPGLTKAYAEAAGVPFFGNYGIPASVVDGAPSVSIPCSAGDWVYIMNRHVHRVIPINPVDLSDQRMAISSHVAEFIDGSFHDFN
jgi:hypothetical protein